MTKTAAYNANEVAAVYMSLNQADLLSTDEGGQKLAGEASLKNGFFGLSDPMNLRGYLESFEMDYSEGNSQFGYKIRIVNPTTELENLIIGFYQEVFPTNSSIFKSFRDASQREAHMSRVTAATSDESGREFDDVEAPPQYPVIYLRFGYGTNSDSGLSRIHKAQVFDIKYFISDSEDKTIELHCVDVWSFARQNPEFNKRLYQSRTRVTDLSFGPISHRFAKGKATGVMSLRKPSEVLTEIIADYLTTYPQCMPIVDLGVYKDALDNIVYSVAAALAEGDVIAAKNKIAKKHGQPTAALDESVESEPLTKAEIATIEELLERPVTSHASLDRTVKGKVTQQVLFQAYKMVFEQIGMKWEMNPVGNPEPITGPLTPEQTSPINTPTGSSAEENSSQQIESATPGIEFNVKTMLDNQVYSRYTELDTVGELSSSVGVNMLSFWPMALVDTPTASMPGGFAHQVLGTITELTANGELHVTDAWDGTPTNNSNPYVCTQAGAAATGGAGTEPPPPKPSRSVTRHTGLVIEFAEPMDTIQSKTSPYVRQYYDSGDMFRSADVVRTAPLCSTNASFFGQGWDEATESWFPPEWYTTETGPPSPNVPLTIIEPTKVKIMNVQGMTQLNGQEFWLYQANSEGGNGRKFFLTQVEPDLLPTGGETDMDWYNKDGSIDLDDYEQGGEIWTVDAEEESPVVQGMNRIIRPLETQEKHGLRNAGVAPLWVNAGLVNEQNYQVGTNLNDDARFKYNHTLASMNEQFDAGKLVDLQTAFEASAPATLDPVPVSVPVAMDIPGGRFIMFTGSRKDPHEIMWGNERGGGWPKHNVPLVDLTTNELVDIGSVFELAGGEFKDWAIYAARLIVTSELDPAASGFSWSVDTDLLKLGSDNTPLVFLEPTLETAWWVLQTVSNYGADMDKGYRDVKASFSAVSNIASTLAQKFIPQTWGDKLVKQSTNAYVTMGDDGENPHISSFLQTILNNINRLVIGQSTKLRMQPIQCNMLSEEDKKVLAEKCEALKDVTWDETWAEKNQVLLVCSTGDNIKSQIADNIIRPVKSFPQTFSASTGNSWVWLDYGTPDSIVAKVEFTGDLRVLVNLAQSNFSVRQFASMKKLFEGNQGEMLDKITNVISQILSAQIEILKKQKKQGGGANRQLAGEKIAELTATKNRVSQDLADPNSRFPEAKVEVSSELLEMLPSLIDSYQTPKELAAVIGENSVDDMRLLASLISDSNTLNFLFPDATVDGNNNEVTTEVRMVTDAGVKIVEKRTKILTRRIDFASLRSRISTMERMWKTTDVSYNYSRAMQQQAWTLDLTTLGLPEIDEPASEILSRKVCFRFYDPRLANGQLHWLSGVYSVAGFKHKINPSQGYLTQLNLIKDPTYNISNIRGTNQ